MNRNSENHFSLAPQANIERSRFDRSHSLKTTFSSGKLVPVFCSEVLPGDTITLDTSSVVRMSTPIFPVMDNCNLDTYFFFVPNRLVWEHWKEFCGEDTSTSWETPTNYQIPQCYMDGSQNGPNPEDGSYFFHMGSLADYMGLPCCVAGDNNPSALCLGVSSLPFRAYYLIWNEFFRAQALQDPVYFPTDDSDFTCEALVDVGYDYVNDAYKQLRLMPVSKYHDYFTSALPSPQKGQPVVIPMTVHAPVLTSSDILVNTDRIANSVLGVRVENGVSASTVSDVLVDIAAAEGAQFAPVNLYADLYGSNPPTINDLRNAFTIQQFMEMQARGGSRYTEIIKTFFGVTSPDYRLQRPEYLGGKSVPINIDQVVQTSASDSQPSPLGSTSAFSLTGDVDNSFTYSSTEHGIIIGLACVRPQHTYQQGIEKMWSRKNRYDYYYPVFANIGEQPVYTKELYVGKDLTEENTVFGYQEAWADYRYSQNRVTGAFRNNHPDTLSPWHYADFYTSKPTLSNSWIQEDPALIERTLAYQANDDVQFLADFYFKSIWTRPMPIYSVPGLTRL